jgi:hypothetical protein
MSDRLEFIAVTDFIQISKHSSWFWWVLSPDVYFDKDGLCPHCKIQARIHTVHRRTHILHDMRFQQRLSFQPISRSNLSPPLSCWLPKVKATCSFKKLVGFQRTTRRYIAEDNVIWLPKVGKIEPEQTSIAMQRLGKHIPAAMNTHATIEEPVCKQRTDKHTIGLLLETVFSVRSVQSGYEEEFSWEELIEFRRWQLQQR